MLTRLQNQMLIARNLGKLAFVRQTEIWPPISFSVPVALTAHCWTLQSALIAFFPAFNPYNLQCPLCDVLYPQSLDILTGEQLKSGYSHTGWSTIFEY